ncbi:MAG: ATP-dependent zinc metalloprotease FtsH [Patescibacteria group bacterium]
MEDPSMPNNNDTKNLLSQYGKNLIGVILFLLLIVALRSFVTEREKEQNTVPLSSVAADIKSDLVSKVALRGDDLEISYKDGTTKTSKKEIESALSEQLATYGVPSEKLSALRIEVNDPGGLTFWLSAFLPFLPTLLIMGAFFWFLFRQVKGSSMQAFSFGQSRARIIDPSDQKQKVTFKDVAGVREAKEELSEIVDFLKNPQKFLEIGARIPKGVLLMGAPGTGKTLLARAVAGEAGVPFLYLSGSEFVEMFVGVGASRTRDLFRMAKKVAPAIIFIDEIDAVGRHRGSGMGGGNDEREQTLNQILVEMDGFEPNEKVIVMAGTNRPDVLDPALLRPGRFDRRVMLDLPDIRDREAILGIHAASKNLYEDVDLHVIAERTPGFSGADLANLVNEAAILAARENRKSVSQYDLIRSIEKVLLGPERKSYILSSREKELTAYHEVGHALVSSVLPYADPVHKVTIISRGRAGGYTLKLPLEEKRMSSKKEFLDDIAVALGGYAAEQMIYGDITTGPSNDIAVATSLARNMVMKYGMSDAVGPVSIEGDAPLTGYEKPVSQTYSPEVAAKVDHEVQRMMEEGLKRAKEVLEKHRKALDSIAAELTQVESLERKEFEELLILNGIKPKKKEDSLSAIKLEIGPHM